MAQHNLIVPKHVLVKGIFFTSELFQVGAQTGHKVTLVDVSQDVLDKVSTIPPTTPELII